eukprot:XP_011424107.2 PREDICTED: E3 ubiquitin-protein ligase Trim36-like [Crassostrea gigas]
MTLDPEYSLQDVVRCGLCETPVPTMYCDICKLNLCKPCVGDHLSDESTEHNIVPFKKRGSTLYCTEHSKKLCDLYCDQCDIPICVQCVSSGEHHGHKQGDIIEFLQNKNEALQRDLKELESTIYPRYQEVESYITIQKTDLTRNFKYLTKALDEQGENMHREIDNVIKELKNEVDEMTRTCLIDLNEQAENIKCSLSEITQIVSDVKKLLNSNDVSLISSYKSNFAKFERCFLKRQVTFPCLSSQKINKQQIYQQFGSLLCGYKSEYPRHLSYELDKMIINEEHEKMSQHHIEQDYDYPDLSHSMDGQRIGSFSKREMNMTRMCSSKQDHVQRREHFQKKPEMQSLQHYHEVRSRRSYVPDSPLPESYPDPTTGTGAVYVNSFPKKAFGRFCRQSRKDNLQHRKDNLQHFECSICNQKFPNMETLQIHVLDRIDQDMTCTTPPNT